MTPDNASAFYMTEKVVDKEWTFIVNLLTQQCHSCLGNTSSSFFVALVLG
jgi:hypothetical protein